MIIFIKSEVKSWMKVVEKAMTIISFHCCKGTVCQRQLISDTGEKYYYIKKNMSNFLTNHAAKLSVVLSLVPSVDVS